MKSRFLYWLNIVIGVLLSCYLLASIVSIIGEIRSFRKFVASKISFSNKK